MDSQFAAYRAWLLCCLTVIVALVACDRPTATTSPTNVGTMPVVVEIQPRSLSSQTTAAVTCPGSRPIHTSFDIIVGPSTNAFRMDTVTIQFIDGSSRTGSPITFPSSALNQQFGSMVVVAGSKRAFSFTPAAGCLSFVPTIVRADVFGVVSNDQPFHTQVSAALQ